ncbi:MAG: SRPBCC family protein [Steroidobacteraceae bacterium]
MPIDQSSDSIVKDSPENEIVITRVFNAPRELVWQAMTDPEQVAQWWGPNGFTTVIEKMELKVGGVWKHVMIGPDGARYPNKSIFTVIREPELIAYSHGGAKEGEQGVHFDASWTFEEINAWTTRLTLRSVFASAEDCRRVVEQYGAIEGGKQTLGRLAGYLAQQPQPAAVTAPITLTVRRQFNASAEVVFDAWLDPEHAGEWLFATPTGRMQRVEINARVGGRFVVVEERAGVQAYHTGEYLEINRPRRLVFSFGVDEALTDAGRVQIDIKPLAMGCELTLTHEMAGKFAEYKQRTQQGWNGILESLAQRVC